jgi:hypothetical protein
VPGWSSGTATKIASNTFVPYPPLLTRLAVRDVARRVEKVASGANTQILRDPLVEAYITQSRIFSVKRDQGLQRMSRYSLSSVVGMYKRRIAKMPVNRFPFPECEMTFHAIKPES